MTATSDPRPYRVLSLDGGGTKGFYTLGVLKEVEALLGKPLYRHFDLVYGTSTGAIIAAFLCLGEDVESVTRKYERLAPDVMGRLMPWSRSRALRQHAHAEFGSRTFDAFLTSVGIVATDSVSCSPMIFKSSATTAHALKQSFVPGFGCSIADAVVASCSAVPFFRRTETHTVNQGTAHLIDGGFSANNPTLFAIADAIAAVGSPASRVKVLSIGVGQYPERAGLWPLSLMRRYWAHQLIETILDTNANTQERLREIFFPELETVRISDSFPENKYATSLLETRPEVYTTLLRLGRSSFAKQEQALRRLLT